MAPSGHVHVHVHVHASLPPMRVLLVNDTQKPIGELRQALTCAGYIVLDDVASVSACMNVSATAIHAAIDDGADVA